MPSIDGNCGTNIKLAGWNPLPVSANSSRTHTSTKNIAAVHRRWVSPEGMLNGAAQDTTPLSHQFNDLLYAVVSEVGSLLRHLKSVSYAEHILPCINQSLRFHKAAISQTDGFICSNTLADTVLALEDEPALPVPLGKEVCQLVKRLDLLRGVGVQGEVGVARRDVPFGEDGTR